MLLGDSSKQGKAYRALPLRDLVLFVAIPGKLSLGGWHFRVPMRSGGVGVHTRTSKAAVHIHGNAVSEFCYHSRVQIELM